METSLTSIKAAFPSAPTPIHGIPTLASLIDLMMHMCRCLQTQKTPALATMNMLFLAASPDLYSYFTNKTYPSSYFPFLKEVDDVSDFSACTSNNERESLKATHGIMHAWVGQKLWKRNKIQSFLWWPIWVLNTAIVNTNAIAKPLIHMLFL